MTVTRTHVAQPAPGFRVSRCHHCDQAYTWKGTARPGCPVCGGRLSTTTRRLRAGFHLLEGDDLRAAELQSGGLAASASWELDQAADLDQRIALLERMLAAGEAERDGTMVWMLEGGRRTGGWDTEGLAFAAQQHRDKAARWQRRRDKLAREAASAPPAPTLQDVPADLSDEAVCARAAAFLEEERQAAPGAELIAEAREADAKARTIERNLRLRRYQGRNSSATDNALRGHEGTVRRALDELTRRGGDARIAAGLITEEGQLSRRLSVARDQGEDRPELQLRLTFVRRQLRIIAEEGTADAPAPAPAGDELPAELVEELQATGAALEEAVQARADAACLEGLRRQIAACEDAARRSEGGRTPSLGRAAAMRDQADHLRRVLAAAEDQLLQVPVLGGAPR